MPESSPASPRRDGLEPVFRQLDDADVPWQPIKSQRNADGSIAHVWEKWLAVSSDPPYLTHYAKYDPGMIVRRHGHFSPHIVFVLEGEATFGDRSCPAGTHIELPLGAAHLRFDPAHTRVYADGWLADGAAGGRAGAQ